MFILNRHLAITIIIILSEHCIVLTTAGLLHTSEYHTQGRMSPSRFSSHQSHSRSHQYTQEAEGEVHDDHHISTLPSDTHMVALCTLDLSTLPGIWGTLLSTGTVDLDKELKVTISGGEDSLVRSIVP